MFKTVMAYLDNLVDWGDSLFAQDTGEAINEATQLYVTAANILGPRPQVVPKKGSVRPQTYAALPGRPRRLQQRPPRRRGRPALRHRPAPPAGLRPGAARGDRQRRPVALLLRPPQRQAPGLLGHRGRPAVQDPQQPEPPGGVPPAPALRAADRPGLLARATAAGLDVGAVLGGINQPLPLVRFHVLAAKAAERCRRSRALGGGLLGAIEKEDNEALSVLRASHERAVLGMTEAVKYAQWQEATKAREGVEQSLATAWHRYTFYARQLGAADADLKLPDVTALDSAGLASGKFRNDEPALS